MYVTNDRRSAIKKQINSRYGSQIVEEKAYQDYSQAAEQQVPYSEISSNSLRGNLGGLGSSRLGWRMPHDR